MMHRFATVAFVTVTAASALAVPPAAPAATPMPAAGGAAVEKLDIGTQAVLDRLRLLRVQMALDREEIAALELRLKKLQLQREYEAAVRPASSGPRAAPPPVRTNAADDIIVKSVVLQPRKEAIVLFRGRMFNVRPGDSLGDLVIRDISEDGLQISSASGRSSAPLR